jgi:hypothetical protein
MKNFINTASFAIAESAGEADFDDETVTVAPKKRKVSERNVLDAHGKPQDSWLDAYGFGYKSLAENFDLNVMFEDIPDPVMRGLAAFGGVTLAGNTTNTVRNGENKGGAATEKEALIAWIENLKAGNWTSPRGEMEAGIGLLAEAYSNAMSKAGKSITVEAAMEKLKAADKEKRAAVRKDSRVKAELTAIIAERAKAKASESEGELVEL